MRELLNYLSEGSLPKAVMDAERYWKRETDESRGDRSFRSAKGRSWFSETKYFGFPDDKVLQGIVDRANSYWFKDTGYKVVASLRERDDVISKKRNESNRTWVPYTLEPIL